ncbi:tetratricopeptide repeat protein [Cerasicoccus maritimus]|uniref:tetratricopeptide repeat protein n=1 Tax=Cerasicoccus maritimus TaxID=490089 RepID=UPI002852A661|nr:tetratricopeptide repeat protein [Cerasicoccus maritimus]
MPEFVTQRGLIVWAESPEAVSAIEQFEVNLLGLTPRAADILTQANEFTETPLVQAYAALAMLYSQSQNGHAGAEGYLRAARRCLPGASKREALFVEAIEHFQRNAFHEALDRLERLTVDEPRDLVAAKACEFLYYTCGQHFNGERFLWHMMRLRAANGAHAGFLSMLSFAYELTGRYGQARAAAEQSLALEPGQPWSHHTLAHLLIRTGQVEEGVREMERFAPYWSACDRGIHAHNAWHRSLFYLEKTDWAQTNRVLREDIWELSPELVGEQIDAIALLWRMDMAGQAQDDVWVDVLAKAGPHAGECLIPFLDGQFTYALARCGQTDAADEAVARARERAARKDREAREIWQPVGVNFVAACAAWGQGDAARAAALIDPIVERLPMVGGSDAQDDLFRLAYFNALAESGRKADARRYYDLIAPAKTQRTPLDELMLAKCN